VAAGQSRMDANDCCAVRRRRKPLTCDNFAAPPGRTDSGVPSVCAQEPQRVWLAPASRGTGVDREGANMTARPGPKDHRRRAHGARRAAAVVAAALLGTTLTATPAAAAVSIADQVPFDGS